MENLLNTIASSPIAASLSLVACIFLLAGYYFFVIPLIKENHDLKDKNKHLEDKFVVLSEQFNDTLTKIKETSDKTQENLTAFKTILNKAYSSNAQLLKTLIQELAKDNELAHANMIKEIESKVKNIDMSKQEHQIKELLGLVQELMSQVHSVQVTTQDVKNATDSIKDKQSTIIQGVIMAGSAGLLNTNIGVK